MKTASIGAMIAPSRNPKVRPVWAGVACALVFAVLYFSLTSTPPDLQGRADKYGHIAGYAALMFWLMQIVAGVRSRILLALGLLALGVGIEVLQAYSGRDLERGDILANAIGIAVGWLAGLPCTFNVLSRLRRALG